MVKAPWTCQYAFEGRNLYIDTHAQVSNGADAPANSACSARCSVQLQGELLWCSPDQPCKVCGLCCTMAYLFATRGLTTACNDRWWTAYLLIVPSMRVSCLRHTVRPLLEELNRQQYREEVDSAAILQTSTRSAASELARAGRQAAESSIGSRQQYREEVDCKCSR